MQFNTSYNPYAFNTRYQQRPFQHAYQPVQQYYAHPSNNRFGSAALNPIILITALFSALAGGFNQQTHQYGSNQQYSGGSNYWNSGQYNNNGYSHGNSGNTSNSFFGNQNPVQDYLGQFGFDYNIMNNLVSYSGAETGVGAGTYDQEKTAYNIYDPTADTNEVYVLSGENSQYMIRNDKGANAFDIRTGDCKEIKLEDLGSDDVIVVADTNQLKLKKHVKTAYGWEFHVLDQSTDSLITIHTRDQDQINNQTGNWETISRDWDYVKERLVTELPADFQ